jgi:branched-chain amino acid transport system ATP-binding protein
MCDANPPFLLLEQVHTYIGPYHVLQGVDLAVSRGQTCMLLGRNGAGKTTCLRTIMGMWKASRGRIQLAGVSLEKLSTPDIARHGVGYIPEDMKIFPDLTVAENLSLAIRRGRPSQERLEWIFGFFPPLRQFWSKRAGILSGGQKQMVSIARAILPENKILLIDEPTKGLAPSIVDAVVNCLSELKATGTTLLLVEQNLSVAQIIGDFAFVLENGQTVHSCSMAAIAQDEELQTRLLGFTTTRDRKRANVR